ncbi:MAG: hypothetical protein ACRERC_14775 [Candidatus Binatia bacterium]
MQKGFEQNISDRVAIGENATTEKVDDCDQPVTDGDTCDPLCSASRACILQPGKTVDDCWRTVVIDVTTDVQNALGATPDYDNVSWLIKRDVESGEGAFHFFSREGAICIMGIQELQPVLEVQLSGSTVPTIPQPPDHCVAY